MLPNDIDVVDIKRMGRSCLSTYGAHKYGVFMPQCQLIFEKFLAQQQLRQADIRNTLIYWRDPFSKNWSRQHQMFQHQISVQRLGAKKLTDRSFPGFGIPFHFYRLPLRYSISASRMMIDENANTYVLLPLAFSSSQHANRPE